MFQNILLTLIDADPGQPRKHFDETGIAELAESMDANGLAVPVLVRPNGKRFMLVHGERRYRAALLLGWETIAAEVRDIAPDVARWLSLVENIQRADLSPLEEAEALQERLAEGITQTELGKRIGKSQSYIAQKLRLLTLPLPVALYLRSGALTENHARQLLRLRNLYGNDLMRDMPQAVRRPGQTELDDTLLKLANMDDGENGAITFGCLFADQLIDDLRPYAYAPIWFHFNEHRPKPERLITFFTSEPIPEKSEMLALQKRSDPLARKAATAFYRYLYSREGQIPQWEAAAFWFATFAAAVDMNVADLREWLDSYTALLHSAIAMVLMYFPDKGLKREREERSIFLADSLKRWASGKDPEHYQESYLWDVVQSAALPLCHFDDKEALSIAVGFAGGYYGTPASSSFDSFGLGSGSAAASFEQIRRHILADAEAVSKIAPDVLEKLQTPITASLNGMNRTDMDRGQLAQRNHLAHHHLLHQRRAGQLLNELPKSEYNELMETWRKNRRKKGLPE